MAEQTVFNKKLLVISLLLGVLAVALFYLYDAIQRRKITGDVVQMLRWKRDLSAGVEVSEADIEVATVPRRAFGAYEGAFQDNELDRATLKNAHLSRDVKRGYPVRFLDISETQQGRPSSGVTLPMLAFPIQVDPPSTPGPFLKPNDRVDLIGLVSVKGKPPRGYTLIQNLRVLMVGGLTADDESGRGRSRGYEPALAVYRSILVEVSRDTAERLTELLPRVQGKLTVVVRNPTDTSGDFVGKINPELEPVLSAPLPALPGAVSEGPM